MARESVVSPPSPGAARIVDAWQPTTAGDYTNMQDKPGGKAQITGTIGTAPASVTGPAGGAIVQGTDGLWVHDLSFNGQVSKWLSLHGSVAYRPAIGLVTVRPGVDFRWSFGRYVWSAVCLWDGANPLAATDSGIGFYPVNHGRCRAGSAQNDGMYVGNVGGVLTFVSRGAGGYEEVPIVGNANPLTEPNKLSLVLTQATLSQDAAVRVLVNGVERVRRTWSAGHKLPELAAATGSWYPHLVHAEDQTYLRAQHLRIYAGPDVETL
jgi:hypothetical protein